MIEGYAFGPAERLGGELDHRAVLPGSRESLGCSGKDRRSVAAQLLGRGGGAHHEVAAVPQISGGNVFLRLGLVRFLDEGSHCRDAAEPGDRAAGPDIAVAGGGTGRRDAEDDDATRIGGLGGRGDGRRNPATSRMRWSAASTSMIAAGSRAATRLAAAAIAAVVSRASGSRRRVAEAPASARASSIAKRWSRLATMIGGAKIVGSATRSRVAAKVDVPSISGRKGFGRLSREAGQSLVPAPPVRMTGMIKRLLPARRR